MNKQQILNGMSEEEFYKLYPTEEHYKKAIGGTIEAFPQQADADGFFNPGFIPQSPVGFYQSGGSPYSNLPVVTKRKYPKQPFISEFDPELVHNYARTLLNTNPNEEEHIAVNKILNKNSILDNAVNEAYIRMQQDNPEYAHKSSFAGGGEAFPQQPDANTFFSPGFIPQSPVGFYDLGGIAFPQQPTQFSFVNERHWEPEYARGGQPCEGCAGAASQYGGFIGQGQPSLMMDGGALKNFFRSLAKKAVGGESDPGASQDDFLSKYNKNFMSVIKNNTMKAIADEATQHVQNTFSGNSQQPEQPIIAQYGAQMMTNPSQDWALEQAKFGMALPHAQFGMNAFSQPDFQFQGPMTQSFGNTFQNLYGEEVAPGLDTYYKNHANQDLLQQKYNSMKQTGKQQTQNFTNSAMNFANSLNPHMNWKQNTNVSNGSNQPSAGQDDTRTEQNTMTAKFGGLPKAQTGNYPVSTKANHDAALKAWNDRFEEMYASNPHFDNVDQYTPTYKSQWTTQGDGRNPFSGIINPHYDWNQQSQGSTGFPNFTMNPDDKFYMDVSSKYGAGDRFLSGFTGGKKHFFGPKEVSYHISNDPRYGNVQNPNIQKPVAQFPTTDGAIKTTYDDTNYDFTKEDPVNSNTAGPRVTNDNSESDNFNYGIRKDMFNSLRNGQHKFGGLPKAQYGNYNPYQKQLQPWSLQQPQENQSVPEQYGANAGNFTNPNQNMLNRPTNQQLPGTTKNFNDSQDNTPQGNNYFDTTITGKRKIDFNGQDAANLAMGAIGFGTMLANQHEMADTKKQIKENSLSDNQFMTTQAGNRGDYNWTGMSNGMLRPNQYTPVQQPGQNYTSAYARFGGYMQDGGENEINEGDEVDMSPEEIMEFMRNGGQIQLI